MKGAQAGVAMVFGRGKRPNAEAVRALINGSSVSISHDAGGGKEGNWLELLLHSLTFDLGGLAGGPGAPTPLAAHWYGLEPISPRVIETVSLDAGPHLGGGEAMMSIVRSQMLVALRLAYLPGMVAIAWRPARSWMGVEYFKRLVGAWLEGGPFPALGLTGVSLDDDGSLRSEGLAFFSGQELRIDPAIADNRTRATKLAVRLINELVAAGPMTATETVQVAGGGAVLLQPSTDGRMVRVRPAR